MSICTASEREQGITAFFTGRLVALILILSLILILILILILTWRLEEGVLHNHSTLPTIRLLTGH
jgi:hypothetical protein